MQHSWVPGSILRKMILSMDHQNAQRNRFPPPKGEVSFPYLFDLDLPDPYAAVFPGPAGRQNRARYRI